MMYQEKPPAFQFYAKDWLSDERVALMSPAAKALYIDCLCRQWLEGSIPADAIALQMVMQRSYDVHWPCIYEEVKSFFEVRGDRMVNLKLEEQRKRLSEIGSSRQKAAYKRWHKRCKSNAKAMQVQCSSSSSSSANKEEEIALPKTLDNAEFRKAWEDWLSYRKAAHLRAYQQVSIDRQWKAMASWGSDAAVKAIEEAIRNSWQGVFPPKGSKTCQQQPQLITTASPA